MSILIPGMEMPTSCDICPLLYDAFDADYSVCFAKNQFVQWRWASDSGAEQVHDKPEWCPLVPVPPHGRLIDADALCEGRVNNDNVVICAKSAPTIIPADPAEEGEG